MNKNQARMIAVLSVAAFVLALLIAGRVWVRLDLTRNKAYTISEVSRNLYRELSDQVSITYFVSDKLRQTHPMPGEIADLIREYAAHSRGKIRFIQKDPAKEEILKEVEDLGIIPQQIQVAEKNEVTVAMVFSGILIEYLDREAVIPVVFSLETLEYDLSSRIRSLIRNVERELGVIVGDGHKQWSSDFAYLNREFLLSGFRVRLINPGEEIPSALPVLFVLGGAEDLEEQHLSQIDRYILGGGNVFFALDGVFVETRGSLDARAVADKGLLAMLANYGVVISRALVLDRSALNLRFQTQSGNGTLIQLVRYPHWIGVLQQGGNPNHPVTSRFQGLDLYWASPLELSPPQGITAETLFSSTAQAWLQTRIFFTNPLRSFQFEEEAGLTRGTKILGASLSGVFPSAFEESPNQAKPSRLIVVGDSDFAGSMMQVNRGEGRNLDFLIRAAEWLSNDEDIVAIRGRQGPVSRLDRITDPEKRDAAMAASRIFNTIVVPLAVILFGLFFAWRRKAKTTKEKGSPIDA
jgi:gliding-associated putative ABC transporter substrate-binding component GldG